MGGSSANYDVELLHHSDMHRDILRAGMSSLPSQFVTLYVIYTCIHQYITKYSLQ